MIQFPKYLVKTFLYLILYVYLTFFVQKYQSEVPWANKLATSTSRTGVTGPIYIQTAIFSYQHVLILIHKPNTTVLMMPLWVQMMKHYLDQILPYKHNATLLQMHMQVQIMYNHLAQIKAQTMIVIWIARIMMIHIHVRHLRKKSVLLFW